MKKFLLCNFNCVMNYGAHDEEKYLLKITVIVNVLCVFSNHISYLVVITTICQLLRNPHDKFDCGIRIYDLTMDKMIILKMTQRGIET